MGKSMTKEQRKNNKYIQRDMSRRNKYSDITEEPILEKQKPKKKWKPHSEIEV